ncbi:vWA domain-containing protein [Thermoproteus tenax]|uniref:VWA domain containing protein n=1 Tax=Thermoproteus tenax (strain ATCC 35583 / DSM 2078 / JCM 9277 / NBRC 100435 / Kra 1) TaxID=768679 RepID=G4RLX7_THETK|nr:VWA domain-containing protein [Thermoproteus tenax]CCC82572.1 vWA domain containing protein [Thermoproteus tenax Kra 1]
MGILLNVDYGDPLAKLRARSVLRRIRPKYVGEEEAIDAFYVHYRRPILGGTASSEAWARFLGLYLSSEYYKRVGDICRLNAKASLEAAVRLLAAYESFLDSLETDEGRLWLGRGLFLKWSMALRKIKRYFGDPHDVYKLYLSLRRLGEVLGSGRSEDPASLSLSIAADPARAKLADIIVDAARIASSLGEIDLDEGDGGGPHLPDGIMLASAELALKRAAGLTRALYIASRELFAYKVATSTLTAKYYVMAHRPRLYILVDKSGSMYDVVPGAGVRRISLAAAWAIALLRRHKGSLVRFFDVQLHKPGSNLDVAEILLKVVPSGGTNLKNAVEAALEEAQMLGPRRYELVVITDGEDDSLDEPTAERARRLFAGGRIYLVGRAEPQRTARLPLPASFVKTPKITGLSGLGMASV